MEILFSLIYNKANMNIRGVSMLFRKDITKCCAYCVHAQIEKNKTTCPKKGIVQEDHHCFYYRYDPCKRTPVKAKAPDFSQFTEDDFKL